jgi:hypothetical protein
MVFSKNLNDAFPAEMNGHIINQAGKFILSGAAPIGIIPDFPDCGESSHFFT